MGIKRTFIKDLAGIVFLVNYIFFPLFSKYYRDDSMALQIYNSLTRNKEVFIPVEEGKVKMYVCGMTVYSDAHIGHARTYFAFDMIRRYLEYKGYDVTYVQNITDVDDKIIAAANKEGVDALAYSRRFTDRCLHDLDSLGIRRATLYPKASETIPDMIEMIQRIIANGYGYEAEGDVYFAVEQFADYGKLSGQNSEELRAGARIQPGEHKRSALDFALWKRAKPGEPHWPSPWGEGRPGWHIECSAMSSKFLGLPFDIHGGGMDLRFPHHENEIAQAEAATGKQFARYWMHIGLLTVEGEKMSKSLGNIINVKELLKSWDAEVIRFFFAQAHYRSPPDFSKAGLENAEKGLTRIHRLKEKFEVLAGDSSKNVDRDQLTSDEREYYESILAFKQTFEDAMDDDFNTPEAVARLFDFVTKSNRFLQDHPEPSPALCSVAYDNLVKLSGILTLFQPTHRVDEGVEEDKLYDLLLKYNKNAQKSSVPELISHLLQIRERARKERNWNLADGIRDELLRLGFEIQDTDQGPQWRKT
jgi:cysteinyl-tRNA synthetase